MDHPIYLSNLAGVLLGTSSSNKFSAFLFDWSVAKYFASKCFHYRPITHKEKTKKIYCYYFVMSRNSSNIFS